MARKINPVERIRRAARRILVVPNPDTGERDVYVLRRFDSAALLAAGIADILGPEAIGAAQEQATRDLDRARLLEGLPEGSEDRARIEAEILADVEQRNAEFVAGLEASPERQAAFLARCDAYAMGAVEAVGVARDDALDGLQPIGTEMSAVCVPLTESEPHEYYLHAAIVRGPASKPNELPIGEMPVEVRIAIGWSAIAALEVASQLRPFRGGSGHARAR